MVWIAFAGTIQTPLSGCRPATKQANQPPQYGVCYLDSKGQEGFPGLVIDKDVPLLFEHTWSFHEVGNMNLARCFFLHPVYQREENDVGSTPDPIESS